MTSQSHSDSSLTGGGGGRTRIPREDNVIDNKKIIFKDELLKILPETEIANIAVGYFYLSGLSVIIKPLKNIRTVRLLISNNIDQPTTEALLEAYRSMRDVRIHNEKVNHVNKDRSDSVIENSQKNITKSLEHMTQTTDDETVVDSLISMMRNSQLEVRVYPKEKLHAKAYIFQPKNISYTQGLGIVGSSNLSVAGFSHNSELNLKTQNPLDVKRLLEWFDELWEDGVPFTGNFNSILENSWAGKTYSPFEIFLKAAYLEYSEKLENEYTIDPVWQRTFPKLFQFQKNAVDQALTMFDLYGGVIIGDVVGLGKTYVGTTLLKFLQMHNYRPLIICPPQLISMWEKFCEEYEVDAKCLSRGHLTRQKFELSRDFRYKSRNLVLIDESHHFRNSNSRQYENLSQFMSAQNAKAILLTATPYSNKANDIKNQLMLFHQTSKTLIPPANETDLDRYFRDVDKGDANLVDLLRNVMIRRTRKYVLTQWGKSDENGNKYLEIDNVRKYFPRRKMRTERYDIDKVYDGHYDTIIDLLAKPSDYQSNRRSLTLARYGLGLYVTKEYQNVELYRELNNAGIKLVGLIRTLLLKRMESSIEAFRQSIKHYINTHKIFLELLKQGIVPIGNATYKEMYEMAKDDLDMTDSEFNDTEKIEELKAKNRKSGENRYEIKAFNVERLTDDIKNDIKIFTKIYSLIPDPTYHNDDKLQCLQHILDNDYHDKKVLIFSEFASTTRYIHDNIDWKGRKEQIDSTKGNSIEAAQRFDRHNNPSTRLDTEEFDETSLLISTDVLSEGVNLQAGAVIINYDFHWNPTRLIQRAGRIDRIGSMNDFITVHNFLLDSRMKQDFRLEDLVDQKIAMIQKVIGEDYEILKKNEEVNPTAAYAIYQGNEKIFDERDPLEPSKFEQLLQNIQTNDPKLWDKLQNMPDGIRSSKLNGTNGIVLLVCESGTVKSGKIRKYYLITSKSIKETRPQNVLQILETHDKIIHPLPSDYNVLLQKGWRQFTDDIEQIQARTSNVKLNSIQRWILERLFKIDLANSADNKQIEQLRKAYSVPIINRKLINELRKFQNSDIQDSELFDNLNRLYMDYNLQNQAKQYDEQNHLPRILYSVYVGGQS